MPATYADVRAAMADLADKFAALQKAHTEFDASAETLRQLLAALLGAADVVAEAVAKITTDDAALKAAVDANQPKTQP